MLGDIGWRSGFYVNGLNGVAEAIAIDGSRVYVGGDFTVAGDTAANRVAMWDGQAWHPLGSGINGEVFALAVDGRGHLYAGGRFTSAGGIPASGVARWDGQRWEALGSGIMPYGWVISIAIDASNNVYVSGIFNSAGNVEAHGIARWDGTSWHALGSGLFDQNPKTGWANALVIDRFGFIYAGGVFTIADGGPANFIARWDGSQWSALGTGMDGAIHSTGISALAIDSRGNLFAGGAFTSAGGQDALNLARWNGDTWSPVGEVANSLLTGGVRAMLADGGTLYATGTLASPSSLDKPVWKTAKWDGSTWQDLGADDATAALNLAMDRDGNLFIVGSFTLAGGVSTNCIGIWDGSHWSALGSDHSVNGTINEMVSDTKGGMFVGGAFSTAGGQIVNHVAHWDGLGWSGLAGGISGGTYGPWIRAMVLDKNGNLIIGGDFTSAGNVSAQNIAKWTGDHWEALGSGIEGNVYALAVDSQNNLYAAGYISSAGSVPVNNIAKWNGEQWEALGSEFLLSVHAIAVDDQNRVVAGGYINGPGGIQGDYLVRWDGAQWEAITGPYIDEPVSILIKGDTIYWVSNMAVWKFHDGIVEHIGDPVPSKSSYKNLLQTFIFDQNGNIIVGGGALSDSWENPRIGVLYRWNGRNWESLGSGTDDAVNSLVYDQAGHLMVAGNFSQAGGKVSSYFAQWDEPHYQWMPEVRK